jgi:Flp pilus assembly protein TadB
VPGRRTRRLEELAQLLDRWAVLVAAGVPPDAAVARIVGAAGVVGTAAHRGPCVVAELHPVVRGLAAGVPLVDAVGAWAAATRCPWVALLAAGLRDAATLDAVVDALDRHATATRRAAQRAGMRRLRRRCWVVWSAGVGTCVATVATGFL